LDVDRKYDVVGLKEGEGAIRLDAETGLAPMPPLGIVAVMSVLAIRFRRQVVVAGAYRIVLPVLRRIHWGMGRFCF